MLRCGTVRYLGLGSPVVSLCPRERPTARVRAHRLLVRCFHRRTYQQLHEMAQVVTGSGLDWTLVRFLQVSRGPGRGLKYVGPLGPDGFGPTATAADIARFTAAQVMGTAHLRDAPAVSS